MNRDEFYLAGGYFLEAHGVSNFRAYEVAPVGRLAKGKGPAQQAPPAPLMQNALILAELLEWVRMMNGESVVDISSWYRDPAYNEAIGGAKHSIHLEAGAADTNKRGMTPIKLALMVHHQHPQADQLGVGLYPGFVHLDVRGFLGRPAPARWPLGSKWWESQSHRGEAVGVSSAVLPDAGPLRET